MECYRIAYALSHHLQKLVIFLYFSTVTCRVNLTVILIGKSIFNPMLLDSGFPRWPKVALNMRFLTCSDLDTLAPRG